MGENKKGILNKALDGCGVGALGAVTAAQPICVAAGPCVWWPRGAEATLDSPGL